MKASSLVVSAMLLLWVNPVHAAGLMDFPAQLTLKLDFPTAAPSASWLLDPDAPLKLESPSNVRVDVDGQAIIAVILSFIVSFGTGHFFLEDSMAMTFLVMEVGLLAALVVGAISAGSAVLTSAAPIFAVVLPILAFAFLGVRAWELVDIIVKATGRNAGGQMTAILPPSPALASAATALQPMAANGPLWRF